MWRSMLFARKTGIIAVSAIGIAVVAGLSLLDTASGEAETPAVTAPPTLIVTGCSGFETDMRRLFDQRGNEALKGTFAPGDHVHLAIDLSGAGYSWQLTDVAGDGAQVTPSLLSLLLLRTTKWNYHTTTTYTPASESGPESKSTTSNGKINGYARWEVEFDVATTEDGTLTIEPVSTAGTLPKVAIASCTSAKDRHSATG